MSNKQITQNTLPDRTKTNINEDESMKFNVNLTRRLNSEDKINGSEYFA
jgi:hypothetical protein